MNPVISLPDISGRTFVFGDIHGMLRRMVDLLQENNFNPNTDRVVACGDLINRGPASFEVLELLKCPWFFSVRGNHEEMLANIEQPPFYRCMVSNGGHWIAEHDDKVLAQLSHAAGQLPYMLEFISGNRKIGVVHANVPDGYSWHKMQFELESPHSLLREGLIRSLLWERVNPSEIMSCAAIVEGVDEIYFGHTIFKESIHIGNRRYIDTGAYLPPQLGGRLTCHIWDQGDFTEAVT